jgi:AraC-like DNA-binding protein
MADASNLIASSHLKHFGVTWQRGSDKLNARHEAGQDVLETLTVERPKNRVSVDQLRWDFGGLTLSQATLTGEPEDDRRHLPAPYTDRWCVVLIRPRQATDGEPTQRGRHNQVLTLYLPKDEFEATAHDLDRTPAYPVPAPFGKLLANFLSGLAEELPYLTVEQAHGLAGPTKAFVAACVAPCTERFARTDGPLASVMIERARHVVRQNMPSLDFGPDQLCRLLAVSRSKLYRFFERSGGVASFIQRERLEEAYRRLCDPDEKRSIHVLAHDVGFPDHSTFSRAFKRQFGLRPSEARERAQAERAASAMSSRQPFQDGSSPFI